jgi:hypothetical protein
MIQSKGEAPVEAFTRLGLSGSRASSKDGVIGQFGSGTKHAINLLLRNGYDFSIYCGRNRLQFETKKDKFDDSVSVIDSHQVVCRQTGTRSRTIECGWDREFGATDWTEIGMALREFISNAIDITTRSGDPSRRQDLRIEIVQEGAKKAKSGFTRIFIEVDEAIEEYLNNIEDYFLHLSDDPSQVNDTFLTPIHGAGPRIYREGVFVRQLKSEYDSCFDYNFKANEIEIDECRNSSESALRATIGKKINTAPAAIIARLFERMTESMVYESGLDDYYLSYYDWESDVRSEWQRGWELFAGNAVASITEDTHQAEMATQKGHLVRGVKSSSFYQAAKKMGVKTVFDVLGQRVADGYEERPATEEQIACCDRVWELCESAGVADDRSQPAVASFRVTSEDDVSDENGYFDAGKTYYCIHEDLGGSLLVKETVKQTVAYLTRGRVSSDEYRDILATLVVALLEV